MWSLFTCGKCFVARCSRWTAVTALACISHKPRVIGFHLPSLHIPQDYTRVISVLEDKRLLSGAAKHKTELHDSGYIKTMQTDLGKQSCSTCLSHQCFVFCFFPQAPSQYKMSWTNRANVSWGSDEAFALTSTANERSTKRSRMEGRQIFNLVCGKL